jgi:serine O-acetyltransferase
VVVKEVPPGRTAIGIPARLVGGRSKVGAVGTAGMAINLDHHLIPDPVGKAIQCLLERIEALEAGLRPDVPIPATAATATETATGTCITCSAGELCCKEQGRG